MWTSIVLERVLQLPLLMLEERLTDMALVIKLLERVAVKIIVPTPTNAIDFL